LIICTRDRPQDIAELFKTIVTQTHSPSEVIVVDDSSSDKVKEAVYSFSQRFSKTRIIHLKGSGEGLSEARNLGVKASKGEIILFLDDDIRLFDDALENLALFFRDQPEALGVQGQVFIPGDKRSPLSNAIYKVFMLTYYSREKMSVQRSGGSIMPYSFPLTRRIRAERLDGCFMGYRRIVFREFRFDSQLKRWGYMEDLDFSYRIHKKHPNSLHVIPRVKVIHRKSSESRLESKTRSYMMTIYWWYIFFKDVLDGSILNMISFFWAQAGSLVIHSIKALSKPERKFPINYLNSYLRALKNLKNILNRRLHFFNKEFVDQSIEL
jgi:GT2 family glycosyltransferase